MNAAALIRLEALLADPVKRFGPPHFRLEGRCVMKKNHNRAFTLPNGRSIVATDTVFRRFEREALASLRAQKTGRTCPWRKASGATFPLACPVRVVVRYHLDPGWGTAPDLTGLLETIGDLLEDSRMIVDDCLICSTDGSRILENPKDPRVDIWLMPYHVQNGERFPVPRARPGKGAKAKKTKAKKKAGKRKAKKTKGENQQCLISTKP